METCFFCTECNDSRQKHKRKQAVMEISIKGKL